MLGSERALLEPDTPAGPVPEVTGWVGELKIRSADANSGAQEAVCTLLMAVDEWTRE